MQVLGISYGLSDIQASPRHYGPSSSGANAGRKTI